MRAKWHVVLTGTLCLWMFWPAAAGAGSSGGASSAAKFARQQENAPRVKAARSRVQKKVRAMFAHKGVAYPPSQLLLRVFKAEGQLELWAGDGRSSLRRVKTYAVCKRSGTVGPKRRQGDRQVPEGFYVVNVFNPNSSFHLSLGIDYPNQSDRILGRNPQGAALGGAIYIHGDCVTIGCVPLRDGPMEELYLAALDARKATGAVVHVHVFPVRLTRMGMALLEALDTDAETLAFWRNLKQGFDVFARTHKVPTVTVSTDGRYHFAVAQ